MSSTGLRVLVLAGGPGREREVSLAGGRQVAHALRDAGHTVMERDILPGDPGDPKNPGDLSALDAFADWNGDVVFPVLHGQWGEGGGLQRILADLDLCYVGSGPGAASLCINKHLTKLMIAEHGVATPQAELLLTGQKRTLEAPVVVKALEEGSTFGLEICKTQAQADAAVASLSKDYPKLLVERYIAGKELTVSVIEQEDGTPTALPFIQIIPDGECYDYNAKYESDATQYLFDIDLPDQALQQVRDWALTAYRVLGIRHVCRADFIVDEYDRPWLIEVNTMPGVTTHSLLPMAAKHAGLSLAQLTDRLVRLAHSTADAPGLTG